MGGESDITNTKCLKKWLFRLRNQNKIQNFKADITKTSQNQNLEKKKKKKNPVCELINHLKHCCKYFFWATHSDYSSYDNGLY